MRYLLDTNIILEQSKLHPNTGVIRRWELDSIFSCTSATVWHELWYGIHLLEQGGRQKQLMQVMEMLRADGLSILPFCAESAEWLAWERVRLQNQGLTATKYDCEIAAVAHVHDLTVVTRNITDFSIFEGVRVENWFDK